MINIEILGLFIAVAGIIYSYYNRRRYFKLVYYVATRILVSSFESDRCKIYINNRCISNLSRSRIIIRNEGNEICDEEFLRDGCIFIKAVGDVIIYEVNEPLDIECTFEDAQVVIQKINFDAYKLKIERLLPNQEFVIDVFHSGNKNTDIIVDCGFKKNQEKLICYQYNVSVLPSYFKSGINQYIKALFITISSVFVFEELGINSWILGFSTIMQLLTSGEVLIVVEIFMIFLFSIASYNYRYWQGLKSIRKL